MERYTVSTSNIDTFKVNHNVWMKINGEYKIVCDPNFNYPISEYTQLNEGVHIHKNVLNLFVKKCSKVRAISTITNKCTAGRIYKIENDNIILDDNSCVNLEAFNKKNNSFISYKANHDNSFYYFIVDFNSDKYGLTFKRDHIYGTICLGDKVYVVDEINNKIEEDLFYKIIYKELYYEFREDAFEDCGRVRDSSYVEDLKIEIDSCRGIQIPFREQYYKAIQNAMYQCDCMQKDDPYTLLKEAIDKIYDAIEDSNSEEWDLHTAINKISNYLINK